MNSHIDYFLCRQIIKNNIQSFYVYVPDSLYQLQRVCPSAALLNLLCKHFLLTLLCMWTMSFGKNAVFTNSTLAVFFVNQNWLWTLSPCHLYYGGVDSAAVPSVLTDRCSIYSLFCLFSFMFVPL